MSDTEEMFCNYTVDQGSNPLREVPIERVDSSCMPVTVLIIKKAGSGISEDKLLEAAVADS